MEGGIIKNNESGNDGGGVYVDGVSTTAPGKVLIRNGFIGVSGGGNRAKYGAGIYAGAYGILELGTDGAGYPYPYIQYNISSGGSPNSTGGGIVINGSGAEAAFYHGTVSNNNGATLGGGILIVNGKLDMRGGAVKNNTATTGPGITVENNGNFYMSKGARALDDPVHLYGTSPKQCITIGNEGFTGTIAPEGIAIVTTEAGYASGDVILKQEESGSLHVNTYYNIFKVNDSYNLTSDGKLP
jgi:hypothetical protein